MTETLHPEEQITSIIFVRHGHTKETEAGKLYTDHHSLLTERGLEQAQNAAAWLKNETVELLLCSEAARVAGSAAIIGKAIGLQAQIINGLNEQHVGDWEGRTYLEIKKADPELYKSWSQDPIRNRAPNGESIEDVYSRVKSDIHDLIRNYTGKKLVLVSHAGVIRSALVAALGMPLDNFWRLSIPTGSISRVDYSNNFATLQYMAYRP